VVVWQTTTGYQPMKLKDKVCIITGGWLVSTKSDSVTGQVIQVSCGYGVS